MSVINSVILLIREDLFSRNFPYAKFRKNKTLTKISKFTVNSFGDVAPIKVFRMMILDWFFEADKIKMLTRYICTFNPMR